MQKLLSKNVLGRRSSKRRGSVFIIVCVAVPMMMGFCALAVDYGVLNVDANRLQRTCDAAALAGASKLKLTNDAADTAAATTEATNVAARNGVSTSASDLIITFPTSSTSAWAANSRIRVEARYTRQLLFARFWNMNASNLGRAATAERTSISGLNNSFVPLVITTPDYTSHLDGSNLTVDLIRMQSRTDFAPSKVIGIRTNTSDNGKTTSHWANDVQNGTTDVVKILDNDVSINASMNEQEKVLSPALDDRISDAVTAGWNPGTNPTTENETAAYPNYPGAAARRIFTIGVADPTPASTGNQNIVLLKFVTVYLVSSDDGRLVFRLMPYANGNSEGSYVIGDGSTDTGLHIVRLIDDL